MYATIEFADGYICDLELIYNWCGLHMYRCEDSYLLVPYKDVVKGYVASEDFKEAYDSARKLVTSLEQDIGVPLFTTAKPLNTSEPKGRLLKPKEDKCRVKWTEVKDSSS